MTLQKTNVRFKVLKHWTDLIFKNVYNKFYNHVRVLAEFLTKNCDKTESSFGKHIPYLGNIKQSFMYADSTAGAVE